MSSKKNIYKIKQKDVHKSITLKQHTIFKKKKLDVICKSIYDVEEFNNNIEYNYNYELVYYKILFDNIVIINNEIQIIPYRFQSNALNNENVLLIRNYYYNKFMKLNILSKIKELFKLFNVSKYFKDYKLTSLIKEHIYKQNIDYKKKTLFMLSSYTNIINNIDNVDIILLQNQVKNNDTEILFFKKKYPNIIDGQSINNLDIFFNSKKHSKYEHIFIEYFNINYNIFFNPLIFIIKLPYLIYLICNTLKILKTGGDLIIDISLFNNSTPLILKFFCILGNLFDDVILLNDEYISISKLLKFKSFKGLDNDIYNEKLIDKLINIGKEHMNKVFTIDDIIDCLKTSKIMYKLDNELIKLLQEHDKHDKHDKHEILYDIPELMFSAIDINHGYKIINLITNAFKIHLYARNYFINKFEYDKNSLIDYFKFSYIKYYETMLINKIPIVDKDKQLLDTIVTNFINKLIEPQNKIYSLVNINKSRKSRKFTKLLLNDNLFSNKIKLNNNFNMYYYQLLLLKRIDCNIINKLSSRLDNSLFNYINNIYDKKEITNMSEFVSLYEILNIYKDHFSKNIINTLCINYNNINIELLKLIQLQYPWFVLNVQKSGVIMNKTNFEEEFNHNCRYIDEISIENTLHSLREYKNLGYTLIIPYINTNICNIYEYYQHEKLQLLYVLNSSCKHSNSITQHNIILDDIHTLYDIDKIYFLIEIIYMYSLLYRSIKIHKPFNTQHNTTFYIIGIDYLDTPNNFNDILLESNKIEKLLTIPNDKYNEILNIINDIFEKCNDWRFSVYKLCKCKNIKNTKCYKFDSGSNAKIPVYFNNPLKLL